MIAEIKRRSPAKGDLNRHLDAAELAATYEQGGASCLSVLTDEEFFGGSVADLEAAREATSLPVLRKDFTVDPRDVVDARLMGADAVLLIAAVLDPFELVEMHQLACEVGLDVLVEVHDEPELEEALNAGATLVGVNQRDLVSFEVDHDRALRMASAIPDTVVKVAESGHPRRRRRQAARRRRLSRRAGRGDAGDVGRSGEDADRAARPLTIDGHDVGRGQRDGRGRILRGDHEEARRCGVHE